MADEIKKFSTEDFKDILQVMLTGILCVGYLGLVWFGKASVEGFIGLATYTIKKVLDMENEKQQNGGTHG